MKENDWRNSLDLAYIELSLGCPLMKDKALCSEYITKFFGGR